MPRFEKECQALQKDGKGYLDAMRGQSSLPITPYPPPSIGLPTPALRPCRRPNLTPSPPSLPPSLVRTLCHVAMSVCMRPCVRVCLACMRARAQR